MAVEIQKSLCGGIKKDNLIESTCFALILVDSECFVMPTIGDYYQSIRDLGVSKWKDCQ